MCKGRKPLLYCKYVIMLKKTKNFMFITCIAFAQPWSKKTKPSKASENSVLKSTYVCLVYTPTTPAAPVRSSQGHTTRSDSSHSLTCCDCIPDLPSGSNSSEIRCTLHCKI